MDCGQLNIISISSFLFSMRCGWVDVVPEEMSTVEDLARGERLERQLGRQISFISFQWSR